MKSLRDKASLLRLLGHPTRLAIIQRLAKLLMKFLAEEFPVVKRSSAEIRRLGRRANAVART